MTSGSGGADTTCGILAEPLFLLDCLVPSSLLASSAQATLRLLTTLQGIYRRLLAYPDLEKYRHIDSDSPTWQQKVAPLVYPLRLAEWGGFVAVSAPIRQQQQQQPAPGLASVGKRELVNVLDEPAIARRLYEVDQLALHWCAPTVPRSSSTTVEDNCQALLASLSTALPQPAEWEAVKRLLFLRLFRAFLTTTAATATTEDESNRDALVAVLDPAITGNSSPSAPLSAVQALDAFFRQSCGSGGGGGDCDLSFTLLSECLVLADGQRATNSIAAGPSTSATTTTTTRALTVEERRALRTALAARFRERHRTEALAHYRASTGDAYRRLTPEEQGAGVTLILDIASAMDRVALLEETQGLVRRSRVEANRLHDKFKQDGDLVFLHRLADEWEEKLEETKQRTGRTTVYM